MVVKKEFTLYGKKLDELQQMDISELAELLPAREKRTLKRGLTEPQKILIKKIRKGEKNIKTHCRAMIILPDMVGQTLGIFNGKAFNQVLITDEMIGHRLGEFALTRNKVAHSAPGIGATRSSAALSVR